MFPHHENEVAQSTCAHGGKIFARYWLHNGMLDFGGAKMSKSLGNVCVLHELLDRYPPEALRYALLSAHYRQPLDWSDALVEQSIRTLDRLYGTLRDLAGVDADAGTAPVEIEAALQDDLNTPEALAVIARLAGEARAATAPDARRAAKGALLGAAALLGILQQDPEAWFKHAAGGPALDEAEIQRLVDLRVAEKKARNFAEADRIREQLLAMGVVVEDTAQGPRWKVVKADERAA
jgi:cysteinyl-tRNA synthetase